MLNNFVKTEVATIMLLLILYFFKGMNDGCAGLMFRLVPVNWEQAETLGLHQSVYIVEQVKEVDSHLVIELTMTSR